MKELSILNKALAEGGKILAAKFGKVGYRLKGRANLLTEADLASQEKIKFQKPFWLQDLPMTGPRRLIFTAPFFSDFMKLSHDVRRMGAASLDMAWLAAGRTDGYWEFGLKGS